LKLSYRLNTLQKFRHFDSYFEPFSMKKTMNSWNMDCGKDRNYQCKKLCVSHHIESKIIHRKFESTVSW